MIYGFTIYDLRFTIYDLEDLGEFFFHRERGVDPMDLEASTLHATKPGHLALGELMDGDLEAMDHLVVRGHAHQILRQEFIL